MKAVWFNSVGEVFDILDDLDGVSVVSKMPYVWNVIQPSDTIKFVEDDNMDFVIGSVYDSKGSLLWPAGN